MKAWVYERYGAPDVLGFEEVETPTPASDEVTVRVQACGLNAADWHVMRADPFLVRLRFGLRRPRRPMIAGCDIAGVVESVGDRVTRFSPGDHVFAEVGFHGGLAELAAVREDRIGRMPTNCTFEEVETPTPAGDEVAVRVQACGLNAADWRLMRADPFLVRLRFGLRRPRRPMIAGCDVAGVVESVGERVTRCSPGDHVYAEVGFNGGLAEVATIREDRSVA